MSLASISFVDKPIIKVNEHESAEMPFRYVKGNDGQPIMPPVRRYHMTKIKMLMKIGHGRAY